MLNLLLEYKALTIALTIFLSSTILNLSLAFVSGKK